MTADDVRRDVELGRSAHRRLDDLLAARLDQGALDGAAPTRLPGWSVGHLLTHLARNADSHRRLIEGADRGEVVDQYDGGVSARNAGIEQGAARGPEALVDDVRSSSAALEAAWEATPWRGSGRRTRSQTVEIVQLPFLRVREVQLHAVDLDVGVTFEDLDPLYVRLEVDRLSMLWCARQPMGMARLPSGALRLGPHERLAWLTGRLDVDGLAPAGIF